MFGGHSRGNIWWYAYKFHQDYLGSLVFDTVLDSTYYKLRALQNRVLIDTFNINRLNLAFVPTPFSMVTTQGQLEKAIHQ